MKRLLLCGIFLFPLGLVAQDAVPAKGGDYVRFVEGEDGVDRLQTAGARFRRGGTTVDLVSVVHLADAAYFEELDEILAGYDAVLYEMVGGKFAPGSEENDSPEEMLGVRSLQRMASSFLGLEFQLEGIDYSSPNFVHADIDWDEYGQLMAARNQSFATLFSRALNLAREGNVEGLPTSEAAMSGLLGRLVTAVRSGDGTELKRSMAPLLGESEGFIAQIEGEDGTVIVGERNRVVLEKLEEEMRRRGPGRFAIFYGAGHMPDLETRLLGEGFAKERVVWFDAWTMEESVVETDGAGDAPAETTADLLLQIIAQNPEVMKVIRQLGSAMEGLQ
ncbi:MAG: hypothetical protein WD342_10045 [Verrucomicrobiales bacterium]